MKHFLFWGMAVVLLAAAVHIITTVLLPRMKLQNTLMVLMESGKTNSLTVLDDEKLRGELFGIASPDLAIAICPYNIEANQIFIVAPLPDTYWSISIFGSNGENIYTINNQQVGTRKFAATIIHKQSEPQGSDNTVPRRRDGIIISSPDETGVVLIRALVPDLASRERINSFLAQTTCYAYFQKVGTGFSQNTLERNRF